MLPVVLAIIVIALAIAGCVALIRSAIAARRKHTAEVAAVAQRLGMTFLENPPLSIIPDAKRFELFNQGMGREVHNHMTMQKDGRTVSVFEYTYLVSTGKSHVPHRQTVVLIHAPGLNLPGFSLRPEHALHRLGNLFGYQDIDVEGDPAFSDAYLLRGVEEELIRGCFRAPVREFYVANPDLCTEGSGADLLVWRGSKVVRPDQLQSFTAAAYVLLGRFLHSSAQR